MTIGIAAFGPNAGAAVLAAWAAAENAGTGDIAGFAVFTAIIETKGTISVECQRGGQATVWRQNASLLTDMSRASVAAVITSGPDRPRPLAQFLAASDAGLITGHRLPNLAGVDRVPVNLAALRLIENGALPQDAVAQICRANPALDAGLIAVTRNAIGLAETAKVQTRTDKGQALYQDQDRAIALLHNSIQPHTFQPATGFADHVARAGMDAFN